MSTVFWTNNPQFVIVEDFFYTLERLGVYWSVEQADRDAELPGPTEREILSHTLPMHLWNTYHKPFLNKNK